MSIRDKTKGFSLVEVVVGLSIVSIIGAVSVPVFLHQKEQAWKASVISDVTKSSGQLQLSSYLDSGNV